MIPKEILKKIRRLEISTRGLVNDVFSGEYHSVFKGRGMNFAEVREYQYGDDIRTLDWNVTARVGAPYVKVHEEERELTVMLVVDVSGSGDFGTVERMKGEMAVEICALLAFSAVKNNDKVGLIIFTDHVEKFIPPRKGRSHVLRMLRELLFLEPKGRGTNLEDALAFLTNVTRRRAVVFLVSDFLTTNYERALTVAGRRHDVVAIQLTDPREERLPAVGFMELEDAETGEMFLVDTSDSHIRNNFEQIAMQRKTERERLFRSMKVDFVEVGTEQRDYRSLATFFRQRARRSR